MNLISRINVDLDMREVKAVIRCLKVLKRYGFTEKLVIKDSPSRTGYHISAWSKNNGVSRKKLIKIRLKARDDKIRCMLDRRSGRQLGVLFTKKEKEVFEDER